MYILFLESWLIVMYIIILLYRGCPLAGVKVYCHGPVGTTEVFLYREVKCTVCLKEVSLQTVKQIQSRPKMPDL